MLSDRDILIQQEHYKDLLREAESYRLIQQARAQDRDRNQLRSRALDWFGRQLVVWGMSLQEHFGSMTAKATESASLNINSEELDLECC